jgi:hypothetical protein
MENQTETQITHTLPTLSQSGHDGSIASASHDVRIVSWLRSRWIDAAKYFTDRTKIALPPVEDVLTLLSFPRQRPVGQTRTKGDETKFNAPFLHDVIPAGHEKLGAQETSADQNLIMISPLAVQQGTKAILIALVYAALDIAARPEQFNDKGGEPRFRKRTKAYNALTKALSLSTHAPNYDMDTSAAAAWAETKAELVGDPPDFVVSVAKTMKPAAKRQSPNKPLMCRRDHVTSVQAYVEKLVTNPLACIACVLAEGAERGLDADSLAVISELLNASALTPKPEAPETETRVEETPATPTEAPVAAPVAARAASPKRSGRAARAHK